MPLSRRVPPHHRQRTASALGMALLLATGPLAAQAVMPSGGLRSFTTACKAMRTLRLPIADSLHFPTMIGSVTVDDRGVLYLTDSKGAAAYAVDSTGRPLGRVAKRGRGPGEFTWMQQVIRAPDRRLYVLDQAGMAVGVLDSSGTELRRIPTPGIGGRRMALLSDSIPIIAGHYDVGRTNRQVVAFTPRGESLWSRGELPDLLRQLRPRLDLSFVAQLDQRSFIVGSGITPEVTIVTSTGEQRRRLALDALWRPIAPAPEDQRVHPEELSKRLSRATPIYEAVTLAPQLVAIGFGPHLALLDFRSERVTLYPNVPGVLSAGRGGKVLMTLPPEDDANVLTWYACEGGAR